MGSACTEGFLSTQDTWGGVRWSGVCVSGSLPACVVSPCTVGLTRALLLAPTGCALPCAAAVTARCHPQACGPGAALLCGFSLVLRASTRPFFPHSPAALHLLLPAPFPPWLLPFSVFLSQALAAKLRLALNSQLSCPCSSVLGLIKGVGHHAQKQTPFGLVLFV